MAEIPVSSQRGCPLCLGGYISDVGTDKRRAYLLCNSCALVFVPPEFHLTPGDERLRYDLHHNAAADPAYAAYIDSVAETVCGICATNGSPARVLDFGAGRHALLTGALLNRGLDVAAYDPLYGIGSGALDNQYDLVVMCEVFEHLREPGGEMARVARALSPGGRVFIRTVPYRSRGDFMAWWYKEDPTHVAFAHRLTMKTVGNILGKRRPRWVDDRSVVFENL